MMVKKVFLSISILLFACLTLRAQLLSPVVVASGGGFATWANGSLAMTFGECISPTAVSGPYILTQGFHQPLNPPVLNSDCNLTLPNAITPESSVGLNDGFKALSTCVPVYFVMRIFDTWGQEIYTSTQFRQAWDGTKQGQPLPFGRYVYSVEYSFSSQFSVQRKRGDIFLLK